MKSKTFKKLTALMIAVMLVFSMCVTGISAAAAAVSDGTQVVYLKPNSNWEVDNARFAVYMFEGSNNQWVDMEDDDADGYYAATLPEGNWEKIIFCRMSSSATENNWDNKWNQTSDLDIPDGMNCYTVKEGTWDKGGGEWSSYTPQGQVDPTDPTEATTEPTEATTEPTEETTVAPETTDYYLFGFINGANYGCEEDYENMGEYKFVDGQLTVTFDSASYVGVKTTDNANWYMTDGWAGIVTEVTLYNTSELGVDANKLMVPAGEVTFTLVDNGDGTLTLSYQADELPTIPEPETTEPTEETTEPTEATTEPTEETTVAPETTDYYLFGFINGANYGCEEDYENMGEYKFVDGQLTVTFDSAGYVGVKTADNANWYMTDGWAGIVTEVTLYNTSELGADADKLMVPAGEVTFTLVDNGDGTLTLSYQADELPTIPEPETTEPTEETTEPTEATTEPTEVTTEPTEETTVAPETTDYYLFGFINGANYGCEEDYENMGEYKFVDGQLTVTFDSASYVGVKTTDNANWYMTDGWAGIVTEVTLYNTSELGADADKLMVPAGEVTFTLVDNGDGTLTLSYQADELPTIPEPETTEPTEETTEPTEATTEPTEETTVAPETTDYYLFGFINGANYGCEEDYENMGEYKFVDGQLTVTFDSASYVGVKTTDNANWYMTDGWAGIVTEVTLYNTTELGADANKLMVPAGEVTFTLVDNGDGTLTLSYQADELPTIPEPETTEPTEETTEPTEATTEPTEVTTEPTEGTTVAPETTDYYLFGFINGANYGCEEDYENMGEYKFVDGQLTVTFDSASYVGVKTTDNANWYMTDGWAGIVTEVTLYNTTELGADANKLMVPAGEVTFTLVDNGDGTLTLSYQADELPTIPEPETTEPTEETTEPTEATTEPTEETTVAPETTDYYLFGFINGANYGCEEDYENMGEYKFVDGQLTVTFDSASYVGVKTTDNGDWFMTDGWLGEVSEAVLYSTSVLGTGADKLMVPAGEVTFILVDNGDGTLTLSYETAETPTEDTTATEETTTPDPTDPVTDEIIVNADSNVFAAVSETFDKDEETITVSYKLSANMKAVNTQWTLTYDDTKLEYDPAYNMDGMEQTICPSAGNDLIFNEIEGGLKGTFSKLNLITFDEGADLVSVTFKVIGTGVADVYLNVEYFTLAYADLEGKVHDASIIDYGEIKDISDVPGFEDAAISLSTEINGSRMMGDVNGDGKITVVDATLIMKYVVSINTLNASQMRVADVDGDGIVNVKDATVIQKYIVGMTDEL